MPARKSTGVAAGASSSTSRSSRDNEDMEYRLKRQRNNDAVKKTRQKSKKTADERKNRVEKLRTENEQLEAKIEEKKSNIQSLKDLLIPNTSKSQQQEQMIQDILRNLSEDDDEDG